MTKEKISQTHCQLTALHSLFYISSDNVKEIPPSDITPALVGEKAFGLSCLPKQWTLPFVVLSHELLSQYVSSTPDCSVALLNKWAEKAFEASLAVGIEPQDQIIVRSSGCAEGLDERGKYYSIQGTLNNLIVPLSQCVEKLISDQDSGQQRIPLIVQKCAMPISARGHLSNERRVFEEKRDWMGQYEEVEGQAITSFQINLRNWRRKIAVTHAIDNNLECNLSAHVSEILKTPAAWGYEQGLRIHFEWVWDGRRIFLVQVDKEHEPRGVDPTKIHLHKQVRSRQFVPKCLVVFNATHGGKYEKIRNVFTYLELGLPISDLYVLDNQVVIDDLAKGQISSELKDDLLQLVDGSLVIRMDVATDNQEFRQLLPRTNEVRRLDDAIDWLSKQSGMIRNSEVRDDVAFILHNFIPAESSAFAYAAPGERIVQIEALWGLPEGLYYNSHDKYIVDTKKSEASRLCSSNVEEFTVSEKRFFKRFFVTPDSNGHWITEELLPPYDWRSVIQNENWLNEIAFESRRIAEKENKSLSIMWFVGVDQTVCKRPVCPWFHELYDPNIASRAITKRTKTPFDRSLVIETSENVLQLQAEASLARSSVRRVKIQPREDKLLRDKNTLKIIGELARKIDAVILLEGGMLSHAYYQLMQTKAIVEVVHPFANFEEKREFNKLVRDKIPSNIEREGEIVSKTALSGEFLLRALREKLIEESFEVLDAVDQDSILAELADVSEVIDGIISHLGLDRKDLENKQDKKRKRVGGFSNGLVLLETKNPIPVYKRKDSTLFEQIAPSNKTNPKYSSIDPRKVLELGRAIDKKWSDRRDHPAAVESIFKIRVPMVRDSWTVTTPTTQIFDGSESVVSAKITGSRDGAKLQIELSLFLSPQKQLKLF